MSAVKDYVSEGNLFCQKIDLNKQNFNLLASATVEYTAQVQQMKEAIQSSKEEVSRLQCSIQALQAECDAVQDDQHSQEKELAAVSSKLKQLQASLQAIESKRDAEQQRLDSVQNKVTSKKRLLDDIMTQNQKLASTAGQGVMLFQKQLGLEICSTSSSNSTVFSFTQIQRSDPERVFSVCVSLLGDQYLLSSQPPLPRLQHLQDRLNQTNNLTGFLAYARKQFKKMQ